MDKHDSYFDGADMESIEESVKYFSPRRREQYYQLKTNGELTPELFHKIMKEQLEQQTIKLYLIEQQYRRN